MINKIRQDFFSHIKEDPFESLDYYLFFGYSQHFNFKRFLDKEKFYSEIFLDSFSKINKRRVNSISITRKLFVELCQINNCLAKEVEEIAVEYYSSLFKSKIKKFTVRTKADIGSTLKMYNVPCGKYYTYSLNTYNIAKDLLLCPYDLYKFCSEEAGYFEFVSASVTNEYRDYSKKIPYYHFDHTHYSRRNEFLALLKIIIDRFKMSDISKRLAAIYYKDINEMLREQIKIDHLKAEKVKNKNKQKEKMAFNPSQLAKDMYRKASKLYHPDKNPNGEETFKIINKAYQEGNIAILKKYSSIT
jgi:hypothetical protein